MGGGLYAGSLGHSIVSLYVPCVLLHIGVWLYVGTPYLGRWVLASWVWVPAQMLWDHCLPSAVGCLPSMEGSLYSVCGSFKNFLVPSGMYKYCVCFS